MEGSKYTPERIAEETDMPIQGLRTLRELMDATESSDPLEMLLRAHKELKQYIKDVRSGYLNRASTLLDTAGAKGEITLVDLYAERELAEDDEYDEDDEEIEDSKAKRPVGFTPNKEAK